jgi:hypothetical protein
MGIADNAAAEGTALRMVFFGQRRFQLDLMELVPGMIVACDLRGCLSAE